MNRKLCPFFSKSTFPLKNSFNKSRLFKEKIVCSGFISLQLKGSIYLASLCLYWSFPSVYFKEVGHGFWLLVFCVLWLVSKGVAQWSLWPLFIHSIIPLQQAQPEPASCTGQANPRHPVSSREHSENFASGFH